MALDTPPESSADGGFPAREDALRPAFAVDAGGSVIWAGPLARRLLDAGGLDDGSAATVLRLAASGAPTMARLRFAALGRAAPLVVRTRPFQLEDGATALLVEALSEVDAEAARAFEEDAWEEQEDVADEVPAPVEDAVSVEDPRSDDGLAAPIADEGPEPQDDPMATDQPASQPPAGADLEALRFVFEIDAAKRLAFLSPDLEAAVGPSAAEARGQTWDDIAWTLDLDEDRAVARALDAASGWSDLPVSWPMADGRRLPLALSALPMFDQDGGLIGFRGLGRAAGSPEPPAEPAPQDVEATPDLKDAIDADRPEPAAEPEEAVVSDPPPVARLLGRNVVPLRDSAPPLLSTSEESAFDEIARRLRDIGVTTSTTPFNDADGDPAAREPWMINDVETRPAPIVRAGELLRLLDRLPVGAIALRGGAAVYANRAALDLLDHPDLASLTANGPDALFAEPPPRGEAACSTVMLIGRDGAEIEADVRLSTIFWEGEPATLVSLKRAEGEIAAAREAIERERETATILDTATDGVLTLDSAGRILSVNRSAEALFGFEARDVIGTLFTLSLAPESRRVAFDYLDRLRSDGVASVMNDGREVLGLVRQGGAIPLYMTLGRIGAPENGRFCAVLRDITPWKKAEEELLAAKRQAERSSRQKSEFLTKVSREIRTPLNAIIGFAEVMMEERFGPVGSPRYKDYLRDIHVSGGHLVGLVDDLVDIARIESGGIKLDPTPVDLNEIASQAALLLQPQANRDHVIIRASLARGMPPVMADRRSVRQIMTTLTANAVRHSRAGGQVIVATATTDAGEAVIRIRDAGAGLTKQELARALEPFRPLGEASEGTSLALPLAKALADANDASLVLSSEPGYGTLAEVVFPAARVLAG